MNQFEKGRIVGTVQTLAKHGIKFAATWPSEVSEDILEDIKFWSNLHGLTLTVKDGSIAMDDDRVETKLFLATV